MTAILYWKGRLEDGSSLRAPSLREGEAYWKPREGEPLWANAVAKSALFVDYLQWFDEVYLPPYKDKAYYQEFTDQLPLPFTENEFFTTMAPFLYIQGRGSQTVLYKVTRQVRQEGEWVSIKTRQYFAKLAPLEDHKRRFEELTGVTPIAPIYADKKVVIRRVTVASTVLLRKPQDT